MTACTAADAESGAVSRSHTMQIWKATLTVCAVATADPRQDTLQIINVDFAVPVGCS
jgi:hypothetical protein